MATSNRNAVRPGAAACSVTMIALAAAIAYAATAYADTTSSETNKPGSCLIAGAAFAGPQMVAAAAGPDLAPAEDAKGLESPAATGADAGVCTAALPAPGSGMTVAGAARAGDPAPAAAIEQAPVATKPASPTGEAVRKPSAKTLAKNKPRSAAPRTAALGPAPDAAKKNWWPAATRGRLNLRYAGPASFCTAIALLFDGGFETPDSANQSIQVLDGKGRSVRGRWVVASNRQMLLFKAAPGLYSINVGSGLADQGGRVVSAPSAGQVFVQ